MSSKIIISIFLLLVCFTSAFAFESREISDCNCPAEISDDKLINPHKIFDQLQDSSEKIKIIVNLRRPEILEQKKVVWSSRNSIAKLHAQVKDRQEKILKKFDSRNLKLRSLFDNQAAFSCEVTPEALDQLLADPNVESIEPVELMQKHLAQGIPLMNASLYRSTYNGQGVAIAICDTGVDYTHPMLGNGGFPNSKVIGGYDFGDLNADPFPSTGDAHGTCCAGIAAGDLASVGSYIGGVAYNAKIYALKVENSAGSIYSDKVVAAWDWCVTHQYDDPQNPILVISTSLGSTTGYSSLCDGSNPSYSEAANNAVSAGITILASSGNDGYCTQISSPACLTNTISVGAVYDAAFGNITICVSASSCAPKSYSSGCSTNWSATDSTYADMVASYSNSASILDIFAPSHRAYTTDIVGSEGYNSGDYYSSFGGTSASAPYAAGAVACLQSAALDITGTFLTPAQIRTILASTGDNITDAKVAITKPRVNLANAIETLDLCHSASVGQAASEWNYPLRTNFHDARTQVIYLAQEIGSFGNISALQLFITQASDMDLNNWTIRMKHTSIYAYESCAFESDNWTTVYQADMPAGQPGWRIFNFDTPFEYNGTDNLMVDFSFNNSSSAGSGYCRSSVPGETRTSYAYSNSLYGNPLDWIGTTYPTVNCSLNVPDVIFTICAPPLDAPILEAEPNETPGICNTISWIAVPYAQSYCAQYSSDSSFETIDGSDDTISSTSHEFCGLVPGQTYWYRIKAINDVTESQWSNIVSSTQCANIADFYPDCVIDFADLAIMANQWLQTPGEISADIAPQPNGDNFVNFLDLAQFALQWMQ